MTENFDDILDKFFDKPEKKMQVEDNENSEQLDLFNVDYAHNGDLPVSVKQKPFASTNLFVLFDMQPTGQLFYLKSLLIFWYE